MKDKLKHIGIIMDGNGRWAKKRLMPRKLGHRAGAKVFREISDHCNEIGLKFLTVYAFSTENWSRSEDEVVAIMGLLREYLAEIAENKDFYMKKNMRIIFIGDKTRLDNDMILQMEDIEEETRGMTGLTLNIAVNYGGRLDITKAVIEIAKKVKLGEISPEDISEEMISDHLYTKNQPDPDMILRTGGEYRLSNFLTWQAAYSEIIVTSTYWPDFKAAELDSIISEFLLRERRFGRA